MPSTTSDRKVQSRIRATNVARAARRASTESSDTSPDRGEGSEDIPSGPEELDHPWECEFKVRDTVWVHTRDGKWHQGKIASSQHTEHKVRKGKTGKYWQVNVSKDGKAVPMRLSPMNGDLKPDTEQVRALLRTNGFLE